MVHLTDVETEVLWGHTVSDQHQRSDKSPPFSGPQSSINGAGTVPGPGVRDESEHWLLTSQS